MCSSKAQSFLDETPTKEMNQNMPFVKKVRPLQNFQSSSFKYKNKETPPPKAESPRAVPPMPKERVVNTYSQEWMRECFARHIACLPATKAQSFLLSYQEKHSPEAYEQLLKDVSAIQRKGYLSEADLHGPAEVNQPALFS